MSHLHRRWVFTFALLCALLLGLTQSASAQETSIPVTPSNAQELTSLVGQNTVWAPALAPDGSQLAWFNNLGGPRGRSTQICVYTFETEGESCFVLPEEFLDYPYQLQWSPTALQIAFSENPVEPSNESDIWLFDLESETFSNLTDDGQTGSWRQWDDETEVLLDYLPMWNPSDGSLYFWRVSPLDSQYFSAAVYRIDPESGDAVLVRDVSDRLDGGVPAFDDNLIGLDGISAISPDGTTLAMLTFYRDALGAFESNLFLLDLTDPEAWPSLVLDDLDMRAALPSWVDLPLVARGLAWTADSAGVLVLSMTDDDDNDTPFSIVHYLDV
ncbi:MAG: hypothetical protein ACRC1H_17850, partial [Caldilineaceae bacterium]